MFGIFLICLDEDNDKRLFEDIYYAYRKQMLMLAESILHNHEDAEDVVSTVFLRVVSKHWNLIRGIQSDVDLRNYLLKATKNTALNMLNAKKRIKVSLDELPDYSFDKTTLSDDMFLNIICDKMQYEQVVAAIQMLEEKYRNVLYYHFVLEWTVPEVAKILNQSISATKKQLVRGKKQLLHLLSKEGDKKNGN